MGFLPMNYICALVLGHFLMATSPLCPLVCSFFFAFLRASILVCRLLFRFFPRLQYLVQWVLPLFFVFFPLVLPPGSASYIPLDSIFVVWVVPMLGFAFQSLTLECSSL